jgi:hypothetical protein
LVSPIYEAVQYPFCQDWVGKEEIPVPGRAIGSHHQRAAAATLVDELIDVLSLPKASVFGALYLNF